MAAATCPVAPRGHAGVRHQSVTLRGGPGGRALRLHRSQGRGRRDSAGRRGRGKVGRAFAGLTRVGKPSGRLDLRIETRRRAEGALEPVEKVLTRPQSGPWLPVARRATTLLDCDLTCRCQRGARNDRDQRAAAVASRSSMSTASTHASTTFSLSASQSKRIKAPIYAAARAAPCRRHEGRRPPTAIAA